MKKQNLLLSLLCILFMSILFACKNKNEVSDLLREQPTERQEEYVQVVSGTENGYDYVDLGLPSGLLWATCNVGTTKFYYEGFYYAWGETEWGYQSNYLSGNRDDKAHDRDHYKWYTSGEGITKYCTDSDYGYNGFTDNKTVLDLTDDAAHVEWGGKWRIPTAEEMEELLNECIWEVIFTLGDMKISGMKVIGPNGNSIFLPVTGYHKYQDPDCYLKRQYEASYWTSSLDDSSWYNFSAYTLHFYINPPPEPSSKNLGSLLRYWGAPIRPVCDK